MSDFVTDLNCGLTWDDSISTSMTPAPSARCPFEYFHEYENGEVLPLDMDEIPADHPVQPVSDGFVQPDGTYMAKRKTAVELPPGAADLIRRIERAPDFGYDDESVALNELLSQHGLKWKWSGGYSDEKVVVYEANKTAQTLAEGFAVDLDEWVQVVPSQYGGFVIQQTQDGVWEEIASFATENEAIQYFQKFKFGSAKKDSEQPGNDQNGLGESDLDHVEVEDEEAKKTMFPWEDTGQAEEVKHSRKLTWIDMKRKANFDGGALARLVGEALPYLKVSWQNLGGNVQGLVIENPDGFSDDLFVSTVSGSVGIGNDNGEYFEEFPGLDFVESDMRDIVDAVVTVAERKFATRVRREVTAVWNQGVTAVVLDPEKADDEDGELEDEGRVEVDVRTASGDIFFGDDDFTDPEFVTGAVLAQLEGLSEGESEDSVLGAILAQVEDLDNQTAQSVLNDAMLQVSGQSAYVVYRAINELKHFSSKVADAANNPPDPDDVEVGDEDDRPQWPVDEYGEVGDDSDDAADISTGTPSEGGPDQPAIQTPEKGELPAQARRKQAAQPGWDRGTDLEGNEDSWKDFGNGVTGQIAFREMSDGDTFVGWISDGSENDIAMEESDSIDELERMLDDAARMHGLASKTSADMPGESQWVGDSWPHGGGTNRPEVENPVDMFDAEWVQRPEESESLVALAKKVEDLQPGDSVDLEGDPYADVPDPMFPEGTYAYEKAVVDEVTDEGNAIAVTFIHQGGDVVIGFPRGHEVKTSVKKKATTRHTLADPNVWKKLEALPALYATDGQKGDRPAVRLFNPYGNGSWIIWEYDSSTKEGFGWGELGYGGELGYVSVAELAEIPFMGQPGLGIERDTAVDTMLEGFQAAGTQPPSTVMSNRKVAEDLGDGWQSGSDGSAVKSLNNGFVGFISPLGDGSWYWDITNDMQSIMTSGKASSEYEAMQEVDFASAEGYWTGFEGKRAINDTDIEMMELAEAGDRLNRPKGGRPYNDATDRKLLRDLALNAVNSYGSATADLVEMMEENGIAIDMAADGNAIFDALQWANKEWDSGRYYSREDTDGDLFL